MEIEIRLNIPGLIELRNSPEVAGYLEGLARQRMAAAGAGNGYEILVRQGSKGSKNQSRVHVICHAQSDEAKRDNKENNTLARVVG